MVTSLRIFEIPVDRTTWLVFTLSLCVCVVELSVEWTSVLCVICVVLYGLVCVVPLLTSVVISDRLSDF